MQADMLPFNIDLLILRKEHLTTMRQVKALDIFDGSSRNFHPEGLFSLETFGKIGDERRSRRFAYIDLKITVFHPVIFKALSELKQLYTDVIASRAFAVWNDELKDFEKSTPLDGETGFAFFLKHFDELQFEERESTKRTFNIKMVEKYRQNCMMDKLIVMPAGLRDFEFDDQGKPSEDEINPLYRKALSLSNLITQTTLSLNPDSMDSIRFSIQIAVNEIYLYIRTMLEGKKKFVLGKWATRRIFNGTRNVITSLNNDTDTLHSPKTVKYNQTAVGLYQFLKAALPVSLYALKTGFLSKVFIGPNSPAVLVNKKTFHKEMVDISPKYYDDWMTDEGLEKVITRFAEEDMRHYRIEVDKYYIGLMYRGPDQTFMLLQDIDELPEGRSKKDVRPITFTELLYTAVFAIANTYPCFVTRYPITSFGSIYPSYVYLKSTVRGETREALDENGERSGHWAYQFPMEDESFMNSVSPNGAHLARLGADNR